MIYTYLAYVPLPDDLEDRLDQYTKDLKNDYLDVLSVPRLTAHVTLMRMDCEAADEATITEGLEAIDHDPVEFTPVEAEKYSQSALALTMDDEDDIHALHKKIAEVFANKQAQGPGRVKPKNQDRYDTIQRLGSPYFGDYYTPHMTVGYTGDDLDDLDDDLPLPRDINHDIRFEATEFVLSRKEQGSGRPYEEVGRYDL
jgi:2'-5' RNA ligase